MFEDKADKNVHLFSDIIMLSKAIWNNYVFWRLQFDYIQHHDATSPYEVKALFPFLFDSRINCACFKVDYNVLLPLWVFLSSLKYTLIQRERDILAEKQIAEAILNEEKLTEVFKTGFFIPAVSSSPDLLKLMSIFVVELDWGDISACERFVASAQNAPILERPDTPIYSPTLTDVISVLKSTVATILHNIILLKLLIGQKVFRKKLYDRAIKVMKWACSPLSASDTMVLTRALVDVEPRINQNAKLPCLRNPKIFNDWSQKEIDDFRQFCVEKDFDNWRANVHEVSDAKGIVDFKKEDF